MVYDALISSTETIVTFSAETMVTSNTGFDTVNLQRPTSKPPAAAAARCRAGFRAAEQGLTLVHFSAQPEPFLALNTSPRRLNTPSTPASNDP